MLSDNTVIVYCMDTHINFLNGGLAVLAQLKKIIVSLPDSLLEEVDAFVTREKINRSELVREAMKLYMKEKKNMELQERMKLGYMEMAGINLQLAEMCFEADNQELYAYEEKLSECE